MPDDDGDDPLCEVELRTYDDGDESEWCERYELMQRWLDGRDFLFGVMAVGKA